MHQTLRTYSARLGHSASREWSKIGGRFHTIRFVERGKEVYALISKITTQLRNTTRPDHNWHTNAKTALNIGWFEDFECPQDLAQVLTDAWPLSTPTLHALPILTARLAQNERTLIDFLEHFVPKANRYITLEDAYTFFSATMRDDTGIGGFYDK